ncbi:MAG: PAS domain S-box protein [Aggregatilineales bacterium]
MKHANSTSPEQDRSNFLKVWSLVALVVFCALVLFDLGLAETNLTSYRPLFIFGVAYALATFMLLRANRYEAAALVFSGATLISILISMYLNPGFEAGLSAVLPVFIAGQLLGPLMTGVAAVIMHAALLPFLFHTEYTDTYQFLFVYTAMLSLLVFSSSLLHQRVTNKLKQRTAQLADSEARFRAVIEGNPDGFFLLSAVRDRSGAIVDFEIIDVDSHGARQINQPVERLIGRRILELFPVHQIDDYLEAFKHVVETGERVAREAEISTDYAFARGWYFQEIVKVGDGVAVINRDITLRKQVENALRDSQARLLEITENMLDMVTKVDASGKIEYATPSLQAILGYPPEKLIGRSFFEHVHPDDLYLALDAVARLPADRIVRGITYRYLHANGRYVWLETTGKGLFDSAGHLSGAIFASRDVSERKRAEERSLALALEKERVQILTTFIQDVSHEFKTPLAAINTSLHLIDRVDDPERRRGYIERAEAQVNGIARLVDMLVIMLRLEAGIAYSFAPANANKFVEELAAHWRLQAEKAGLKIELRLAENLPNITMDREWMRRALDQLVDNAVRCTPDGGTITLMTAMRDDHVLISVRDTGHGISQDALPRIFERFFREDIAHTTPGFGLGLPIAHLIVSQHQGHINVASMKGQGSLFEVVLPVKPSLLPQ